MVVHGTNAGARLSLGDGEFRIGRDPDSQLRLDDPECAWRHCSILRKDEGYELIDHRSNAGTRVNGIRSPRKMLRYGDQIAVGETVLVFQKQATGETAGAGMELFCAATLLYLFRALAAANSESQMKALEEQIIHVIGELLPVQYGIVVLGKSAEDLEQRESDLAGLAAEAAREGPVTGAGGQTAAAPLFVRGLLEGAIAIRSRSAPVGFVSLRDTLSSIASLASMALENAREVESLQIQRKLLEERVAPSGIVGESLVIRKVLEMTSRVAPQDTTILILGESGTGKELVANAIHEQSNRRARPFVAINCAALTETLLESELFGHEKGSFTGALAQKKGKLEIAEGGTVFLDEIGEMSPALQAKMLRVLQEREFQRVGGTKTLRLDVRVLAATNKDLLADVKKGLFREDLYHRLNVVAIRMPALRERGQDVLLLARYFLVRSMGRCGRRVQGFSPEAESLLLQYNWPGNVRELENAVERAVVLGNSDWVLPEDLPETILEAVPSDQWSSIYHVSVGGAKRDSILRAWAQAKGDYKAAAELLGLHPNSLLRLIRNLHLRDRLRGMSSGEPL